MKKWTAIEWNKDRFKSFRTAGDDGEGGVIKKKFLKMAEESSRDFKRACPKCNLKRSIENFGLRRLAYTDSDGKRKIKVVRQSWCNDCRREANKKAREAAKKAGGAKKSPKAKAKADPKKAPAKKVKKTAKKDSLPLQQAIDAANAAEVSTKA